MYVKWAIYWLLNLPIMIMCYITNPVVVLFADNNGELPVWCKWWQTHDDSVFTHYVVYEQMLPKLLLYDYYNHYACRKDYSDIDLAKVNNWRWYSDCINADFNFVEKIKRYICGVYWLMRNCAYGFAFWLFGCNIIPADVVYKHKTDKLIVGRYLNKYFIYKDSRKIFTLVGYDIYWNNFVGWKLRDSNDTVITRCPLAIRIAFKIKKVGDNVE